MNSKVSCLCLTYNRPGRDELLLLEEAVMSFLQQTYPDKELLILNDHPGQKLFCNYPGVKVFNFPERFETLTDKIQFGIE